MGTAEASTLMRAAHAKSDLVRYLTAALTKPSDLDESMVQSVEQVLSEGPRDPLLEQVALALITAIVYSRPDLITVGVTDRLRALVRSSRLSAELEPALSMALRSLLFTSEAPPAVSLILEALHSSGISQRFRRMLLEVLRECVHWRPDLLEPAVIVELAESIDSREDLNFVLDYLVERYVFLTPEAFEASLVERLVTKFAETRRLKYLMNLLPVRVPEGQFPLRASAARILRNPSFKLLVVVNSLFGQGDEMVRTVPLLQAIVDANPTASITVLGRRGYLFDHPQIKLTSIMDDDEVQQTLRADYDGVVHFHEPKAAHCNCRPLLVAAVSACIDRLNPRLVLEGDHVDHRFTFQRLRLDGRELAAELGLDQQLLENIYEPSLRLLAEMGLPMRLGEDAASSASVLVGTPSPDADRLWVSLVPENAGERKVALVNPFGGSSPEKGYMPPHFAQLATELCGLIDEGYHLVILPNGTRWGSLRVARAVAGKLPETVRRHVSIAPYPAAPASKRSLCFSERLELNQPDRLMRLFKYLAARADLIVTVEGWMSHLAYNLGRPFRLMLMTQSPAHPWYPHARGPDQQLVTRMSPFSKVDYLSTDLPDGRKGAPFPRRHRKEMLRFLLTVLGSVGGTEGLPPLINSLRSPDHELRQIAVANLGGDVNTNKAILLGALKDSEQPVRAEAASALLRAKADCRRELGPQYTERLEGHIAVARRDWDNIERLGLAALPALAATAKDRSYLVREEAVAAAAKMLPIPSRELAPRAIRAITRVVLAFWW